MPLSENKKEYIEIRKSKKGTKMEEHPKLTGSEHFGLKDPQQNKTKGASKADRSTAF